MHFWQIKARSLARNATATISKGAQLALLLCGLLGIASVLLVVAATLAATLVAFDTRNPAGQRLIDDRLLNVVLVLLLTTSILGPILTQHFAPGLLS
jgi:hypothetical protein